MKWQRFTSWPACLTHSTLPAFSKWLRKQEDCPPPPPSGTKPQNATRCRKMTQATQLPELHFAVIFEGYDPEKHAVFELVPRLIGRNGDNMKKIHDETGAHNRLWSREWLDRSQVTPRLLRKG